MIKIIKGFKYFTVSEIADRYNVSAEELEKYVVEQHLYSKVIRGQRVFECGSTIYELAHKKKRRW